MSALSHGSHRPPEKLDCWHSCDRRQAASLLLNGACKPGTFLLRPCHSRIERYALSVLQEKQTGSIFRRRRQPVVRNYLIKEKSGGYYIFSDECFKEVHYLITFYSKSRRRMHTPLRFPFPKANEAAAIGGADGKEAKQTDNIKQRLRLVQKISEGSYEIFSTELNGRCVVSVILDGGSLEVPDDSGMRVVKQKAEKSDACPPLPPKPKPDIEEMPVCPYKSVPPLNGSGGSGGNHSLASMARDRLDRCGRLAERMLQLVLK